MPLSPASEKSRLGAGVVLAFLAIYVLWGSTFLAIRVAVETVPPFLAAGIRFFLAGFVLYGWSRARGVRSPTALEWRNLAILGALLFLIPYSGLFWAEKTVPSGIASVLVATIPISTALLQVFVLRKERFRWSLFASLCLGFAGVGVLALDSGPGHASIAACLVILLCSTSWAIGTVIAKEAVLPESKVTSAGAQMVIGGALLLLLSMLAGEWHPLPHISPPAAGAIAYLIVAGSIVAFTAYLWLLGRMPATTVTSYAYVNPVVALLLGRFIGNEELAPRTLAGAALVLASVLLITKKRSNDE
jgi:drug/metabolite transporter (DMT)-like permease